MLPVSETAGTGSVKAAAAVAAPHSAEESSAYLSARMPEGMFMHSRASANADSVIPTAAAPTPKLYNANGNEHWMQKVLAMSYDTKCDLAPERSAQRQQTLIILRNPSRDLTAHLHLGWM